MRPTSRRSTRPGPLRLLASVVLGAVLAVAPVAVQDAAAGTPQDLGVPISSYLILDTVLADDAQGEPTLYGSTYNAPSSGVTFFGVDPETGDIRTQHTMPGAYGGYHVTVGTNGRIYLGPENSASLPQIWEYDPQTDVVQVVATAPEGLFCFGMAASPNGKVYCGAYGKGIYEYDPATSSLQFLLATATFPKGLLALDATHLLIAEGTPAHIIVYDRAAGTTRDILPAQYANYSFAYNAVKIGSSVYVQLVTPDSKILRFDAATLTFQEEVPTITGMGFGPLGGDDYVAVGPGSGSGGVSQLYSVTTGSPSTVSATGVPTTWTSGPRLWPTTIAGDTWLTSIGTTGELGRWNPDTGELWTKQLTLPGNPTNITALAEAPDGSMCGGTYETNALFCYDPSSGDTEELGNVAPGRSGEILSATSAGGKLFLGSYTNNVVTVYDPGQSWDPGTGAGSNPRDLGPVGTQQYRPWDMTVGPDGRVWVASSAAYGVLGGALTAIDPSTYAVDSYRSLAGDQHFFSITTAGNKLVAGTSVYGDDTNAGGSAQILVVSCSGSVVSSTVPVVGATRIEALATAPDGTVFGSTDTGAWFRYDPAADQVTAQGTSPYGTIHDLTIGPDGLVYGASSSGIFRIDPAGNTFASVATPGTNYFRTLAFDATGRLYWGSNAHLYRVTP